MEPTLQSLQKLDSRRIRLGMSKADLARRAGVSLPTVHRVFSGRDARPRADVLASVAAALGVEVRIHESTSVPEFRAAQARAKAKKLARLVQGTMALEAEAVGEEVLREIEERNVHALLAGPARRLWGE